MNRRNLLNIGKFLFIALLIFLMVYVIYVQPIDSNTEEFFTEKETTLNPGEGEREDILKNKDLENYTLRDSIVEYAVEFLGTPYVDAGSGRDGFDCSGYVYYVYQHFDIDVPRSTSGYTDYGTDIPIGEVEKGDLLLFLSPTRNAIGHIGIITNADGTDSDFIHATSGQEMKVINTNLSNEGYSRRFIKAIRVL